MNTNDTILVVKGNRDLRIQKGDRALLLLVEEGERRSCKVRFSFLTGALRGKTLTLWVNHVNRMSDPVCRLNTGNPLQNVEIELYRKCTPTN